jgi:hypothetical protein
MKLLLPISLLLGLPLVTADCIPTGIAGDTLAFANSIKTVCAWLGHNYQSSEIRSSCINFGSNRWNFYIYNLYGTPHYMDPDGCVEYMAKQALVCQYGGDSTYADIGWRFV